MERETRFELATLALARRCSTTELLPLVAVLSIPGGPNGVKPQPEWKLLRMQDLTATDCRIANRRILTRRNATLFLRARSHRRACRESGWRQMRLRGCG